MGKSRDLVLLEWYGTSKIDVHSPFFMGYDCGTGNLKTGCNLTSMLFSCYFNMARTVTTSGGSLRLNCGEKRRSLDRGADVLHDLGPFETVAVSRGVGHFSARQAVDGVLAVSLATQGKVIPLRSIDHNRCLPPDGRTVRVTMSSDEPAA